METPKRKNRRSHKKTALQKRRPPKVQAPAPKRRSRSLASRKPSQHHGTAKFSKKTISDISVMFHRELRNAAPPDAKPKRYWIRLLRALFKRVWDYCLAQMTYRGT
jgi:hypothetical protein